MIELAGRACLLALFALQAVVGQDSALVSPGARVRYWLPEISKPVEAEVVSWSTDRIRVRRIESGDTLEFARSALSRLEVRRPEAQGEAGAAVGLFGGAVAGSFQFEHGSKSSGTYQGDVIRAYLFAAVCAGVGWVIGSRVHRYRWEAVPLDPPPAEPLAIGDERGAQSPDRVRSRRPVTSASRRPASARNPTQRRYLAS